MSADDVALFHKWIDALNRDGLLVRFKDYGERRAALEAAGLA
jgi:hypothetical protein